MATILVVDDDPTARDLLATVLQYASHTVLQAQDGPEGLQIATAERVDLIIVDLLMPSMNGLEFVRRLRENEPNDSTPVAFYTASYLESEAQALARACGVTQIITKPAEPQSIFDVVNAALGAQLKAQPVAGTEQSQQAQFSRLTASLSQKAAHVVPRLEAMIELGLRLASERDPERLLSDFCGASRKIIGAKLALTGIRDRGNGRLKYSFTSDLSGRSTAVQDVVPWESPIHAEVLETRTPRRLSNLRGDPTVASLSRTHGPVHCLLCVPIQSPQHVYGSLTLVEKIGAAEFSDEDEALAQILAAQVGRIYENGSLYREVKQYAERLEEEIAERKRAQSQIEAMNAALERTVAERTAQLREANTELEAFGYTVSHDLRAPLRRLSGFSSLLLETEAHRLTDDGQHYLQLSIENVQRMSQMVDDLLAFSQMGRQELSLQPVNMQQLVEEVRDELLHGDHGPPLEFELGQLPTVMADRGLLREVWINLIANALKYSSSKARREISITSRPHEGEVQFDISDNGIGFDAAEVPKLFQVFQRLPGARQFEGTGAGLAIVERIVRRHSGRIWAEGRPGAGATFHFSLPIERQGTASEPAT